MSLYDLIVNFFNNLIFANYSSDTATYLNDFNFTLFNVEITLSEYLSHICSLIVIIIIFILCSLFVYKIIKLIGGLIR